MGFADGLIAGIDAADRTSINSETLKRARLQNEDLAEGLQMKKQDTSRREAIRQAGIEAFKSPPAWTIDDPTGASSIGTAQPSDAAGGAPIGNAAPGAQPTQQLGMPRAPKVDDRDSTRKYLDGLDAMHRKALEVGDVDAAAKLFQDHEDLRMKAVGTAMDAADRQFFASGGQDYKPFLDTINRYLPQIPGAAKLKSITPVPGTTNVTVTKVKPDGTEESVEIPAEQARGLIDKMRDPAVYRAARIANERFAFQERTKADEKIREEKLKAQNEARFKGIKVGAGEKLILPGEDGRITPDRVITNDRPLKDKGYDAHTTSDGSLTIVLNKDDGTTRVVKNDGVDEAKATAGWPRGTKYTDIEKGSKEASSHILDIQKNPTTGFDTVSQDDLYKTTARASEIFLEGKGTVDPRRAAEMAVDEGKRNKILKTKDPAAGGGRPRMPMPSPASSASAPKKDGGVNGVQLFYGAPR